MHQHPTGRWTCAGGICVNLIWSVKLTSSAFGPISWRTCVSRRARIGMRMVALYAEVSGRRNKFIIFLPLQHTEYHMNDAVVSKIGQDTTKIKGIQFYVHTLLLYQCHNEGTMNQGIIADKWRDIASNKIPHPYPIGSQILHGHSRPLTKGSRSEVASQEETIKSRILSRLCICFLLGMLYLGWLAMPVTSME